MNNKTFIVKQNFWNKEKTTNKDFFIKIFLIIGLSFIGSFVYQNIVNVKIYIPGLYWIPQTITYTLDKKGVFEEIGGPFKFKMLTFYLIGLAINVPLLIFSYFKIDRKYTLWTTFSIFMYTLWGLFYNINNSQLQNFFKKLETHIIDNDKNGQRSTKVEFYLTALVAGILMGTITSFLWKRNISGGGFDIIYTYLAIKKRRTLSSLTIPISCTVVVLNVLLNTLILKNEKVEQPIYIFFFLINSAIFAYSYTFVLDFFYPKFAIVTILIISKKLTNIEKVLLKNFKRTATLIKGVGLYEKKPVDLIYITSTFLEKNVIVKVVKQVDPKAFISIWSTQETHGNFFVGFK